MEWLKKIFHFKSPFSQETCYKFMDEQGEAVDGKCGGLAGGDRTTGYLQLQCVDCPHLTIMQGKEVNSNE